MPFKYLSYGIPDKFLKGKLYDWNKSWVQPETRESYECKNESKKI